MIRITDDPWHLIESGSTALAAEVVALRMFLEDGRGAGVVKAADGRPAALLLVSALADIDLGGRWRAIAWHPSMEPEEALAAGVYVAISDETDMLADVGIGRTDLPSAVLRPLDAQEVFRADFADTLTERDVASDSLASLVAEWQEHSWAYRAEAKVNIARMLRVFVDDLDALDGPPSPP